MHSNATPNTIYLYPMYPDVSTKCFNHPRVVRLSNRLWLRWWQLFDVLAGVLQNLLAFLAIVVRFT